MVSTRAIVSLEFWVMMSDGKLYSEVYCDHWMVIGSGGAERPIAEFDSWADNLVARRAGDPWPVIIPGTCVTAIAITPGRPVGLKESCYVVE